MALDLLEKTAHHDAGSSRGAASLHHDRSSEDPAPRHRAGTWQERADCERGLAGFLDDAFAGAGVVLHDRPVTDGRHRATIDHLIVATSGVWVVDAYSDNHLLIGWSQQKTHVDGTGWQTATVQAALAAMHHVDVPVHRVLCFSHSDWARRPNAAVVDGVLVLSPDKLCSVASQPGQVRGCAEIAGELSCRLTTASR